MKENIKDLLKEIEKSLSPRGRIELVKEILKMEYSTPRRQKEIEERNEEFYKTIETILEEHFTPMSALFLIARLGESLLKKHPELSEIDDTTSQYTA